MSDASGEPSAGDTDATSPDAGGLDAPGDNTGADADAGGFDAPEAGDLDAADAGGDAGSGQDGPDGAPTCFDLSSGFSLSQNPNPPWTFGGYDGVNLVTYDKVFDSDPVKGWYAGSSLFDYGLVAQNTATIDVLWSTSVFIPSHGIVVHPGMSPITGLPVTAVVRWAPPRTGDYVIRGSFSGAVEPNLAPATTTDVHVVAAGNEIVTGSINLDGAGNELAFYGEITLAEGDVVEFKVGWGDDGTGSYDSTGLSVTICLRN
jgi:hypothetical protein